jgi:hypothetical protein
MHATTGNTTPSRSVLSRLPYWSVVFRHPRIGMAALFTSGSWNLFLAIVMLGYGFWLGLLPLAAAAVLFWVGARVHQITQSRPAASVAGQG